MGYLSKNFALEASVLPLLQMLDGNLSIDEIHSRIDGSLSVENLLDFVQLLDQHRLLHSEYFHFYSDKLEQDFENSETRDAFLAGDSYPDNADQLQAFVNKILTEPKTHNGRKPNALYAPHIEISVGEKQYGEAFSHLKGTTPKRVILLATSHYADYYFL